MRRILLIVAYDGTNYHGWQVQDNGDTIEGELNKAIKALTNEVIEVIGASRTDAGVHGLCNRAVFDTESTIPADKFAAALNSYLPDDIRVRESREVASDWHPRHCSTHKTYEYRIDCGNVANPLLKDYCWHMRGPLDVDAMRKAAEYLVGEHDFTSFCSVNGTALTNVRTVLSLKLEVIPRALGGIVEKEEIIYDNEGKLVSGQIVLNITGTGFLYNMVRIIAGTLVHVGMGRFAALDVRKMLEAKDRTTAGPTAPPQGLTLTKITDV